VVEIEGVVKAPVAILAPPVDAVYQSTVPVQPVVDRFTVPVPHLLPFTAAKFVVTTLTVTVEVAAHAAGAPT
jgi:hypothetical protein